MRGYVDMVADLFHHGHVSILKRVHDLGYEVVVGIHSDETVASYKRHPILTMEERIKVVKACKYVHEVIPSAPLAITKRYLDEHKIDMVFHGSDTTAQGFSMMYKVPIVLDKFQQLPYTETISTTAILERIIKRELKKKITQCSKECMHH